MRRRGFNVVALGLLMAGTCLCQLRPALAAGTPAATASLAAQPHGTALAFLQPPASEGESQPSRTAEYFEWLNFAILVAVLVYVLRKPLSSFFSGRSAAILKGLEEGRKALDESLAKLKSIEQKLEGLNDEVSALKTTASREMEAEAERMRQQTRSEAERIGESARAQIEAATRAAKIELKAFAAGQATELAEQMVRGRLDRTHQGKLVQRFFDGLNGSSSD